MIEVQNMKNDQVDAIEDWLAGIGRRNVSLVKHLTIDIGSVKIWGGYGAPIFEGFLSFTQRIEDRLLLNGVTRQAVSVAAAFRFTERVVPRSVHSVVQRRTMHSFSLCDQEPFRQWDYSSAHLSISRHDKLRTIRAAGKAFASKIQELRKHEGHGCQAHQHMFQLLRPLAICRDTILAKLRSMESST